MILSLQVGTPFSPLCEAFFHEEGRLPAFSPPENDVSTAETHTVTDGPSFCCGKKYAHPPGKDREKMPPEHPPFQGDIPSVDCPPRGYFLFNIPPYRAHAYAGRNALKYAVIPPEYASSLLKGRALFVLRRNPSVRTAP